MAPARSLHEIFAGLSGDAAARSDVAAVLDANGYADLPQELLAQAVVSFADTAPAEVAEHLAPFVTAHSQIGGDGTVPDDLASPLDLLATVPDPVLYDPMPDGPGFDGPGFDGPMPDGPEFDAPGLDAAVSDGPGFDGPGFDGPGSAASSEIDAAFGDGLAVDDREPTTVEPTTVEPAPAEPTVDDAGPAGHDDQQDAAEFLDGPLPSGDPWAMPSISEGTAEIDGAAEIDGIGAG